MASLTLRPAFICTQCVRALRPQFRAPASPQSLTTRTLRTGTRSLRRRPRGAPQGVPTKLAKPDTEHEYSDAFSNPTTPAKTQASAPRPVKKTKEPKPLALTDDIHAYWETLTPEPQAKQDADIWFDKKAKPHFLRSVAVFREFPVSDVPEVAFVGRSNVGKSSLLNALVNADIKEGLARVSKTPGCTRTLNLYGVGPHDGVRVRKGKSGGHDRIVGIGGLLIVDLPGYGEGSLAEWGTEIMKYLTRRKELRRVFVLVDAAVGLKDGDRSLLAGLRFAGVPHQVIISKLDKVYLPSNTREMTRFDGKAKNSCRPKGSPMDLLRTMEKLKGEVKPPQGAGALGELLSVSSEVVVDGKRLGLDAVRVAVLQAAGVKFETKKTKMIAAKKYEQPSPAKTSVVPEPEVPRMEQTSPRKEQTSPRKEQSSPRESSPRQSSYRQSSPRENAPRQSSYRQSSSKESSPRQSSSKESSPRQSSSRESSPRQSSSRESSPRENAPRQSSYRQSSSRESSPRESSPRQSSPRQSSPRQSSPKQGSPKPRQSSPQKKTKKFW